MASLLNVSARVVVVVPITPHISEFRANCHDSLMSAHENGAHISIAIAWTRSCHCSNILFLLPFMFAELPYLLWQAAQTLGCHHWQWAQSHFHLSGWLHIAGPDLQVRQTRQKGITVSSKGPESHKNKCTKVTEACTSTTNFLKHETKAHPSTKCWAGI